MTIDHQIPEGKRFIAKTIAGLEEVLAEELISLGSEEVEVLNRAVGFTGDKRLLYKVNYCSRTALRILSPLFSFQMVDEDDLYSNIYEYAWEELMDVAQTLAIDAVVSDSELTHSHFVALRSKDAIVDRFREKYNGRRPSVDIDNPDFRINIHIFGNTCDVSLDSSGLSLHKRGYRVSNAEAPMSEVLAAGLILLSGWDKKSHFIDPMCGSGTLLIEAALIANNFPAGLYRKSFGFMRWKDFDQQLWDEVINEAQDQQAEFEYQIIGNDISAKNLAAAKINIKSARLHKDIQLRLGPFADLLPPEGEPGILIINPPYGERIKTSDIIGLYKEIGNTLKKNFIGYKAWVISSDHYALKSVGLKATKKVIIWNGPLECRYAGFELYEGSRKLTDWKEPVQYISNNSGDEAKHPVDGKRPIKEHTNLKQSRKYNQSDVPVGSPKRDNKNERPYRKDERPYKKDDSPFHRSSRESGPSSGRRDRTGKPFVKEDQKSRPFRPKDQPENSFRKDERNEKDFSRSKKEYSERKPKRFDESHNNISKSDRPERKEFGRHPFKRDDRTERSSRFDKRDSRSTRSFNNDQHQEKPDGRKDRFSGKEQSPGKPIELYQPQNRFEKPEKAYRRKDGRVNEGDPSGSKIKPKKPPRPRKPGTSD